MMGGISSENERLNEKLKEGEKKKMRETKNGCSLTWKELEAHDKKISEDAYRKAAECTIQKFNMILDEPLPKFLRNMNRYLKYLAKTYNIKE